VRVNDIPITLVIRTLGPTRYADRQPPRPVFFVLNIDGSDHVPCCAQREAAVSLHALNPPLFAVTYD